MQLNLGCGLKKFEGFINIDIRREVNPDIIDDVSCLSSIRGGSISKIVANHILEHFPSSATLDILNCWRNKLVSGGVILIEVPNILDIIDRWAGSDSREDSNCFIEMIRDIFGSQDYEYNTHYTGFSVKYLFELLVNVGFKDVVVIPIGGNIAATGCR